MPMSLQSLIMLHFGLTRRVMSGVPAGFWTKRGERGALCTFSAVSQRVPAYKRFLHDSGVSATSVRNIRDFAERVPVIDKATYLQKGPLSEYCLDGQIEQSYTVETSSGLSGQPLLWPRSHAEDALFPKYIEFAFRQFYRIDQRSTLVILTLALGTWTAGEKMAQALRLTAAQSKYRMTVVTPGMNLKEAVDIARELAPHYDQTVIIGYPPFVKCIIDEGERQGLDWKQMKIRIGLGGEGYSEEWREHMASRIGLPERDLLGVSGGYGAADVGMSIGREYPITVLLRKLAHKDPRLARDLFGDSSSLPSFLQYSPTSIYIEAVDGELVFTVKAGIPLVRYNIHDRGGVLTYQRVEDIARSHGYDVLSLLRECGYDRRDIWRLPFFYVFGRSDGVVSLVGVNIYVESIHDALTRPRLAATASGNFHMSKVDSEEGDARLRLDVELRPDVAPSDSLAALYQTEIADGLRQSNSEYRKLSSVVGSAATPVVVLHLFGDDECFPTERIKNAYIRGGPHA